jgi:hypothetical protein
MGVDLEARPINKVEIDPSLIKSGDFLASNRMDGSDPLIMYGVGSWIGHSSMALWMDGELYVVESYGGGFRPHNGIMKTKWADFLTQMENADCFLNWLPLSAEQSAKFDEQAAIDFFNAHEGLPYGVYNFLFGWIDTPSDNWPPLLPRELAPVVFSVLESLAPSLLTKFFTEGMNKRLGTDVPHVADLAAAAAQQQKSLQDVMAEVEQDGWIYTDGTTTGESYVCSAFVAGLYQAAGLFEGLDIQATEFTPRNIYELAFFDTETPRP